MNEMQVSCLNELEAVNSMLGAIGESPIDSLEDMTDVDAITAQRVLQRISREQQARGWTFNKCDSVVLSRLPDGTIPWNENFLYIKDNDEDKKLIRYGEVIKDLVKNTTHFDKNLEVELVVFLPFEQLPEQMRNWVLCKATYVFLQQVLGDNEQAKHWSSMMNFAWQELQEFEIDNNNDTMLNIAYVQRLLVR